ncbi:hypothetical protein [Variovorax sp. 38R]|uniref:hypothetical protein n=1 Tax=Variovorax sp. 38R TaxID=2774875 RepID=UPI001781BD6A|nr:hypothetical protein [Variovorax sp. 38R]QOF76066.1 hypothetical protein IG196_16780 [Variovorax sp. 38R]
MKPSTGLRNHVLASGSVKAAFDGVSEIRIYAGAIPADADAATTGATLLVTLKKDGTDGISFAASPAGGVLAKNPSETWTGLIAASGAPAFFRHVITGDADGESTAALRYQGSVGVVGAEINLTSAALVSGESQALAYYQFTWPAG